MKDLFGQAILDYQTNQSPENLYTETSISELDVMPIDYLFRGYDEMPVLEQKALDLANGKVLDVGCGAGSHSLYLQEKEKEISAIDISPKAVEACLLRGIQNVKVQNFLELDETEKFDTILFLMNGTGVFQNLVLINVFLDKIKKILNKNGQVLIDGTDIIYMFDEDEDGGKWIPSNGNYYGELDFTVHYKGEQEEPIQWLYLDFDTLKNACEYHQLSCTKIKTDGDSYLAKISL
ncbi:methyltransferase domain-containing protein [Empedobacter falsenii]